jgi:hypothetical protein
MENYYNFIGENLNLLLAFNAIEISILFFYSITRGKRISIILRLIGGGYCIFHSLTLIYMILLNLPPDHPSGGIMGATAGVILVSFYSLPIILSGLFFIFLKNKKNPVSKTSQE